MATGNPRGGKRREWTWGTDDGRPAALLHSLAYSDVERALRACNLSRIRTGAEPSPALQAGLVAAVAALSPQTTPTPESLAA